MKLPVENTNLFIPKIRNLTKHEIRKVKVRTDTHEGNYKKSGCELVLDLREKSKKSDPRIDIILVPGKYTDEIEHKGLESALTSKNERLRSIAILMQAFSEEKAKDDEDDEEEDEGYDIEDEDIAIEDIDF